MDSQDKKKYHKKGISLKLIAWIIAAFVFVISSALVSISILIVSQNQKVNQVTSNYITLKQASTDIQGASDYLTSQVRLFSLMLTKNTWTIILKKLMLLKEGRKPLLPFML